MALVELNSINVFYSTWYLEDIAFNVTLKYFSIFMLLLSLKQAISLAISVRQDIFVVRLFLRFHGWDLKFMKLKCRQIYCFSSTAKLKCSKISFLNEREVKMSRKKTLKSYLRKQNAAKLQFLCFPKTYKLRIFFQEQ